ncbi:MAG: hypothetical protein C7B45_03900 [Sulfobacillus acidophilus]|uniref:Uncharacterized protein n=1 Tax=Sulfobacillus acidophilus TaxID=53633 RepID=A0A2T2WLX8_9FIRM|nr:MAG: hypothetical protein C7B45_03900 [Sulfobacillus acidophilus]
MGAVKQRMRTRFVHEAGGPGLVVVNGIQRLARTVAFEYCRVSKYWRSWVTTVTGLCVSERSRTQPVFPE